MTPSQPPTPPPDDREARLTALLLGELSADEAAGLRQQLEQDTELRLLHDRLAQTIGLVREAAAAPDLDPLASPDAPKLSAERREKLLASFKVIPIRPPSQFARWRQAHWREVAALAAMLVALFLIAAVLTTNSVTVREASQKAYRDDGGNLLSSLLNGDAGKPERTTLFGRRKAVAAGSGPASGNLNATDGEFRARVRAIGDSELAGASGPAPAPIAGTGFTAQLMGGEAASSVEKTAVAWGTTPAEPRQTASKSQLAANNYWTTFTVKPDANSPSDSKRDYAYAAPAATPPPQSPPVAAAPRRPALIALPALGDAVMDGRASELAGNQSEWFGNNAAPIAYEWRFNGAPTDADAPRPGGTGNLPAPSGPSSVALRRVDDSPDGTTRGFVNEGRISGLASAPVIPPGGSPGGTGGSPVPPISTSSARSPAEYAGVPATAGGARGGGGMGGGAGFGDVATGLGAIRNAPVAAGAGVAFHDASFGGVPADAPVERLSAGRDVDSFALAAKAEGLDRNGIVPTPELKKHFASDSGVVKDLEQNLSGPSPASPVPAAKSEKMVTKGVGAWAEDQAWASFAVDVRTKVAEAKYVNGEIAANPVPAPASPMPAAMPPPAPAPVAAPVVLDALQAKPDEVALALGTTTTLVLTNGANASDFSDFSITPATPVIQDWNWAIPGVAVAPGTVFAGKDAADVRFGTLQGGLGGGLANVEAKERQLADASGPVPARSTFASRLTQRVSRAASGAEDMANKPVPASAGDALGVLSANAVGFIDVPAATPAPVETPKLGGAPVNIGGVFKQSGLAAEGENAGRFYRTRGDASDGVMNGRMAAPTDEKKLAEASPRNRFDVPPAKAQDFEAGGTPAQLGQIRDLDRSSGEKPVEQALGEVSVIRRRVDIALPAGERSEGLEKLQVASGPVAASEVNYALSPDPATGLPVKEPAADEFAELTKQKNPGKPAMNLADARPRLKLPTGGQAQARGEVEKEIVTAASKSKREADAETVLGPGRIKLRDASLAELLDAYQDLSGRTVVKGASLPAAKITMENSQPLTREEARGLLETVLAMNQVTVVPQGDKFAKAVPQATAGTEAKQFTDLPNGLYPASSTLSTHVIQLKNAAPNDLAQVLQPFAKLQNSIVSVPSSSMIVVRDYPENVKRMVEIAQKVDVIPPQDFVDVVIPIKNANAAEVAQAIGSLTAGGGGVAVVGQQQMRTGITSGGRGGLGGGGLQADQFARTNRLAQAIRNLTSDGELFTLGQTKIIADERTSSLLVFASRQDLVTVSNILQKLDAPPPKLAPDAPVPQPEVSAAENFFSTFSLNVSDVSFKLAAASLEKGQMPEAASVRTEEFINAFDYRDPEPGGSAPVAFAWERARYPFAHDRDLVRFSVKTAASGRQPGRPLNLVLAIDNSGSMERADRVRILHECLRVLGGQLQPQDRVSVVAFARTARLVVDGFSGKDAARLPEVVGQLAPDGGTNLEDAMNLAYQSARRHYLSNGVNRVVLLTDGAANLGDVQPESLKKKVEAHRQQGIALDCFGIGWEGFNDDLLEQLSRNGDGRYGFVNSIEAASSEFAGQLAGALKVAASDVKVQVEWNPRRVTAWRQIGYAKHQLKKEQFRDNTVDAAEIGAAEAGNALYTVQVNPAGEGPLGTVRVRFKVPGTSDYREHEWPLPYAGGAKALEQSSAALRLAASASAFSEWLVSSPFAAEVTPDQLLGYLRGVPETWGVDARPKKLEWMIRQAKSVAGR